MVVPQHPLAAVNNIVSSLRRWPAASGRSIDVPDATRMAADKPGAACHDIEFRHVMIARGAAVPPASCQEKGLGKRPTPCSKPYTRLLTSGSFGGPGGDLLFHALRRSTIGAEGFNGRVRDGIGCFAPRYDHQTGQTAQPVRSELCVSSRRRLPSCRTPGSGPGDGAEDRVLPTRSLAMVLAAGRGAQSRSSD